jgi:pimeloyl-ACP methyl ester carboxylesterase
MTGTVEELDLAVDGIRVFARRVPGEGTPVVYCHGNPTHSEDWLAFLERGGPAIAIDMPGWGRSDRPDAARFDYSMYKLSAFLEKCLDELGIGQRKLVAHDWGSVALIGAQRRPELVEKLIVIDAVPLLPGYRWHWIAQLWRRKPIGEFLNATTSKSAITLLMRQASGDRRPMPPAFVDLIWRHWDKGTQQAVLALYRHADPDRLAAAGRRPRQAHMSVPGPLGRPRPLPPDPLRRGLRGCAPQFEAPMRRGRRPLALDRRRPSHRRRLELHQLAEAANNAR